MVTRNYQINKQQDIKYYTWLELDVEMSQSDVTQPIRELSSTEDIKIAVLVRKSDAAQLTTTISNNQVTCTNAGLNMQCVLFVVGVKSF